MPIKVSFKYHGTDYNGFNYSQDFTSIGKEFDLNSIRYDPDHNGRIYLKDVNDGKETNFGHEQAKIFI